MPYWNMVKLLDGKILLDGEVMREGGRFVDPDLLLLNPASTPSGLVFHAVIFQEET